jgi:hypothetical protein
MMNAQQKIQNNNKMCNILENIRTQPYAAGNALNIYFWPLLITYDKHNNNVCNTLTLRPLKTTWPSTLMWLILCFSLQSPKLSTINLFTRASERVTNNKNLIKISYSNDFSSELYIIPHNIWPFHMTCGQHVQDSTSQVNLNLGDFWQLKWSSSAQQRNEHAFPGPDSDLLMFL